MSDGSAPEQVDALAPRWEGLPAKVHDRLAYRWVDYCVRAALPLILRRHAWPEAAHLLNSLPTISDVGTLIRAEAVVSGLVRERAKHPELPIEVLTALFSTLTFLQEFRSGVPIWRAAFMTVMTSRLVHGDDRLMAVMEADLAGASRE